MTESEFTAMADRVLEQIGHALDASDGNVDWQLNDGILEIDCADGDGSGGKIIVNRHVPNREMWLATRGGGYHYRLDGARWVDTRGGSTLADTLAQALEDQAGERIVVTL